MTLPTPEKLAELRALAKACIDSIGPVGSSTAPFLRALRAYQEEARPEVLLSILDALEQADERVWRESQRCHYAIDAEQGMGMHPVYCSVPRRYHVNKGHEFTEPKPLDKLGIR